VSKNQVSDKRSDRLQDCDPAILAKGRPVCALIGSEPIAIEQIVAWASEGTDQPVDWYYVGDKALVLTTGSPEIVMAAIEKLIPTIMRLGN
jgi:hypothetical protein